MVRPSKSSKKPTDDEKIMARSRLKNLAIGKNIVSESQAKGFRPLRPTKQVLKHHGKDILRKSSQRKNRFLFSFPGLLAPTTGGKIGDLKNLGTQNPVLYLEFPQGTMKLFGTIVYPENKYLTLQFSRGGKNVMCEDYFDNMIVFSDAWWIGRKEENPDEVRLDFPKELTVGKDVEYNFKGGAGAAAGEADPPTTRKKDLEEDSPEAVSEDDFSDIENSLKAKMDATPIRQSGRTAGKTFKFVEVSSEDEGDAEEEDNVGKEHDNLSGSPIHGNASNHKTEDHGLTSKKQSESAAAVTKFKADSTTNGTLVQATISTLFKRVEEKAEVSRKKGKK